MDMYETHIGDILDLNFTNVSDVEDSIQQSWNPQPDLPYSIPDCPAGSILQILFYIPDYLVQTFFYKPSDKLILTYIYPFIFATGVITNLAFLFTVARVKQMRTTPNFYLVNVAVADLTLIVTKGTNSYYRYIWSSEINRAVPYESPVACAFINSLAYLGYFASVLLVTLVSFERYMAICHPLKHRMVNSRGHTIKVVSVTWMAAIFFTGLAAPNFSAHYNLCIVWPAKWQDKLPVVMNICTATHSEFYYVVGFSQSIPFAIALFGNSFMYFMIIRRLGMRDVAKGSEKGDQQIQAEKVRNAVTRMLVVTGIVFFVCLAPFQFYNIYLLISRFYNFKQFFDPSKMQIVAYISRVLDLINSSVNPIIYSATNPRYRKAFLAAFGCASIRSQKRKEASSVATTKSTI